MREVLRYPDIEEGKLEAVKEQIVRIAEGKDCAGALRQLQEMTGRAYAAEALAEYWGWTDLDTLARKALMPEPPRAPDLTWEELTELIELIQKQLTTGEDAQADYYIELLHKSLSLPDVADIILSGEDAAAAAERMLQKAAHTVIAL